MVEDNPETPALKTRHVAAATIGNALEFYDFLTYAFFSIQIGHAFFPSQSAYGSLMLSLATFGAGFVTRPIGALVIGAYADRVGRRPAMMLCFVLMGCSIVAMALIPTYATIGIAAPILAVIARLVQGFSLGGEIGSEHRLSAGGRARRQTRPRRLLAGREPEPGRASPAASSVLFCRRCWRRRCWTPMAGASPSCSAPSPCPSASISAASARDAARARGQCDDGRHRHA